MRADELLPDRLALLHEIRVPVAAPSPPPPGPALPNVNSLSSVAGWWGLDAADVSKLHALERQLPLSDRTAVRYDASGPSPWLLHWFESTPAVAFAMLEVLEAVAGVYLEMAIHQGLRREGWVCWLLFLTNPAEAGVCS